MSSRALALQTAFRYHSLFARSFYQIAFEPLGLSEKTSERSIANLQKDDLLRSFLFDGRTKLYTPTAKAARIHGFDERRYTVSERPQALTEHLTFLAFRIRFGHELMTPREFATLFPQQAACTGMSHSRYYVDKSAEQPLLSLIAPDFGGADVRRIVRKVRKEVARRKEHEAWRLLVYNRLFAVTVVTALDSKADLIRDHLAVETFPHSVVALPEILEFALRRLS